MVVGVGMGVRVWVRVCKHMRMMVLITLFRVYLSLSKLCSVTNVFGRLPGVKIRVLADGFNTRSGGVIQCPTYFSEMA